MTKQGKKSPSKKDRLWAEAKRKCRLSLEDIGIAREMGLNPHSLIKNIPSESELWKQPVKDWIHELYQKRQEKSARTKARREQTATAPPDGGARPFPEDCNGCLADGDRLFKEGERYSDQKQIQDENRAMLRRQEQFHLAAEYIADRLAGIPAVQKVVLFGSVASPLEKEIPRFREFRRAGITIYHECQDVDMAVWVSDLACLKAIQQARSQALNDLLAEKRIGVAHHQIDIFVMESGADVYLGRLCIFGSCPKRKNACRIAGCGEPKFLQQHEGFAFQPKTLDRDISVVLLERHEEPLEHGTT
jgi:hypothetical protein